MKWSEGDSMRTDEKTGVGAADHFGQKMVYLLLEQLRKMT